MASRSRYDSSTGQTVGCLHAWTDLGTVLLHTPYIPQYPYRINYAHTDQRNGGPFLRVGWPRGAEVSFFSSAHRTASAEGLERPHPPHRISLILCIIRCTQSKRVPAYQALFLESMTTTHSSRPFIRSRIKHPPPRSHISSTTTTLHYSRTIASADLQSDSS